MGILTKIIVFILLVPVIGVFLWGIVDTKGFITFGDRWRYKEELEPTDEAMKYSRKLCIICLAVTIVGYFYYAIFS